MGESTNDNQIICLENISKRFPLYANQADRFWFQFPLLRRLFRKRVPDVAYKDALVTINLSIKKGEKVGIIGSNGSGKTTLLNLISGYTEPSKGQVNVSGSVQALMQSGLGFVEDLSGSENVKNALQLNGLTRDQREKAFLDIVDFVELGDFFNYPFKTYSLGMRARLEFATATAIYPDVLVVDEVLGAGDGYFAKKCAQRMSVLVSETTLLLVSHSMGQIYDFCDRVVWINKGKIVGDGSPEAVIKSYEAHMSNEEAKIQASIRVDDSNTDMSRLDFHAGSEAARQASQELLHPWVSEVSLDNSIAALGFGSEGQNTLMLETGDPLDIQFTVLDTPREAFTLRPVVYAFSENGSYIWRAYGDELSSKELLEGNVSVRLHTQRFVGGVGNYYLTIVLEATDVSAPKIWGVAHSALFLKVMETNYSDPPFLHCPGVWSGSKAESQSRICAWV